MSISKLLEEYGLIALTFHFTVWVLCLVSVYSLFSFGLDISSLPEPISRFLASKEAVDEGATGVASMMGRLGATLAVVEVVGPFRIALTMAATPAVSGVARKVALVRQVEETINGWISAAKAKFRSSKDST
jgi:hypothetical protein